MHDSSFQVDICKLEELITEDYNRYIPKGEIFVELLPEWNGKVKGVMHRMYMTENTLAKEMGVTRQYASKVLNSQTQTTETRIKVEAALESFARSRGICFNELWALESRSRMP